MSFINHHYAELVFKKLTPRAMAYYFYVAGVLAALAAAAVLINAEAQMQTEPAAALSTTTAPKYNSQDIERAFGFIDANKDGKISREEASGFRNVAKYFDAADTDKDGVLSPQEFGGALNRP